MRKEVLSEMDKFVKRVVKATRLHERLIKLEEETLSLKAKVQYLESLSAEVTAAMVIAARNEDDFFDQTDAYEAVLEDEVVYQGCSKVGLHRRKMDWLNVDKLAQVVISNEVTNLIINNVHILQEIATFKVLIGGEEVSFNSCESFCNFVSKELRLKAPNLRQVVFSYPPSLLKKNLSFT